MDGRQIRSNSATIIGTKKRELLQNKATTPFPNAKGVITMEASCGNTVRLCVCSSEDLKLIGSTDGFFPDMGHHVANEMNGMWLHPIKLFDGFWLKLDDHSVDGETSGWIRATKFTNHPYGNTFHYTHGMGRTKMRVERFQFAPDGVGGCVVSYKFTNRSATKVGITCELLARTDLSPVWLSEQLGIHDGSVDEAVFIEEENAFLAKDCDNEWYAAVGCDTTPDDTRIGQFFAAEVTAGNGVSVSMSFSFHFEPFETKELVFYFAGSYQSREDCLEKYRILRGYKEKKLLEAKIKRYDDIRSMSELVTQDSEFNKVFEWVKVNTDWLVVNVPSIGCGVTAGLPEYPFWFGCDGCYTIMGLLATGQFEIAKQTLRILREASERHNGNGRIIHEITTADALSNAGNTQETAQFITTIWEYLTWTGDLEFVKECFPYMKKSIAWLEEMDEDNDGFPSGYGIMEVEGMDMELVDTAVYTCTAFDAFGRINALLGNHEAADAALRKSKNIKKALLSEFWLPDKGLFADTITTAETVKARLSSNLYNLGPESEPYRDYLESEIATRACTNTDDSEAGWLLNASWVIFTPLEMGLATKEQAEIALANMFTEQFTGPYGGYLSGLKSDRRIMTISTNVYAAAQARYGYADRALEIINRMFSTFSKATPGSISEMSPDYGCFVQGWTHYCATTIVKYFFGINPDVSQGKIFFSPSMPSAWDSAEIKNVRVGSGSVSVSFMRVGGVDRFKLENKTGFDIIVERKDKQNVEIV